MTIQINHDIYIQLSESEKNVAQYIMKNEEKILSSSITSIAHQTFTSSSTVSRTIQKMGFSGIAQLRYEISSNVKSKEVEKESYTMNKVIYKVYNETNRTIDALNVGDIINVSNGIKKAERIFVLAQGATALIARDFELWLQYLGYNVSVIMEDKWFSKLNFLVNEKDIVIVLTSQCTNQKLITATKLAKAVNCPVYVCCCKENTGLENYADVFLLGHSEIIMEYKGDVNYSRIALLIITRTITEYLSYEE